MSEEEQEDTGLAVPATSLSCLHHFTLLLPSGLLPASVRGVGCGLTPHTPRTQTQTLIVWHETKELNFWPFLHEQDLGSLLQPLYTKSLFFPFFFILLQRKHFLDTQA